MNQFSKILLIAAGTLAVFLGFIGMFVPLLPTTPFLLLAAWCYARSSERFYRRLVTNRWFGEYIRNYREGRGMALREKILTLLLLWITITNTFIFVASAPLVRIALAGIAVGVTLHLLSIKTYRPPATDNKELKSDNIHRGERPNNPDAMYCPDTKPSSITTERSNDETNRRQNT